MNIQLNKRKSNKKVFLLLFFAILLMFGIGSWLYANKGEREAMKILEAFHSKYPAVEFPSEYDVKKNKEWDSGVVQWELEGSDKMYLAMIENGTVVKFTDGTNNKELYPAVAVVEETSLKNKVVDKVKEVFKPSKEAEVPKTEEPTMNKVEYTITISKLLGEALINIDNVKVLVESPEFNQESISEAEDLLQESIDLYEVMKGIVPPEDWKLLHESILSHWETYITGEEGLVNSMEQAWSSSADERKKAMEVMKEKGEITGDYSLQLGELILQFLGELTGISTK